MFARLDIVPSTILAYGPESDDARMGLEFGKLAGEGRGELCTLESDKLYDP